MSVFGPDEWAERERLDHIAQQHEEDRVAKDRELQGRLGELEAQVEELGIHLDARDHALRFVSEHAELVKVERDRLKAALGPAANLDEPCGNKEPSSGRLACTLPEGHVAHYAAGSGTGWQCICAPTADQAAVTRVRELLPHLDTLAHKLSRTLPEQACEAIKDVIGCVRVALDPPEGS